MRTNNSTPRLFSFSQELLYMVASLAWTLCRRYLSDFTSFKAMYTNGFVDDAIQAVINAKNIADLQQRNIVVQNKREALETRAATFFEMFQNLKRYITSAFPKSQQPQQLLNAGSAKYEAAKTNLEDLHKFIETATKYVGTNIGKLMENNNMPATFEAEFKILGEECTTLINDVLYADNTRKSVTVNKNVADNAIYTSLIVMLVDGQRIFKNDRAISRQFVLSQLLKLARASRPAQLKGYVFDSVTGKPLEGVTVRTINEGSDYSATTSKKGRYDIARILGGATYMVQVLREGYVPTEMEVTIQPGVGKTIKFKLVPADVSEKRLHKAAA